MKNHVKLFATTAVLIAASHFPVVSAQAAGRLDLSFGGGAGNVTGIQIGSSDFDSSSVLLQPDGKVVVVGKCYVSGVNTYLLCAARLNVDGSRDFEYGAANGEVSVDSGTIAYPQSAVLQPDGKIVVAGMCDRNPNPARACFARLSGNGRLDPTFRGPDGSVSGAFLLPSSFANGVYGVSLQPHGKIVAVGSCSVYGYFCVLRLNADGTVNTTFGAPQTPGKRVVGFTGTTSGSGRAVSLLSDGKILVAAAPVM